MVRICCCALVVGALSAICSQPAAGADDYRQGTSEARAVELVEAALTSGLQGDNSQRQQKLAEAVAADGEFAPARWQSGQVKFQGEWRTPDEVAQQVAADERYEKYRQMRDASGGSLEDHIELAEWCMRNELANEERYHWVNVILAAPGHKLARQRLELREYRGGLFTEKQIADNERQMKAAAADAKKYKPLFTELVRKARGESASVRKTALAKIGAVSDLGAIDPLLEAIGSNKRDATDERTIELHRAVVAALSNMRAHTATLYLMNYAVFAENEDVRKRAAEALKPRAPTDYVPLLMAALKAPIEAEFDVVAAPDGTVRMVGTLVQAGPEQNRVHTQATHFEVSGTFGRDRLRTNVSAVVDGHLQRARQQAESTQDEIDAYNEAAEQRNARIREVLQIATGMSGGVDPEYYWAAWRSENELYYSDEEAVYETYDEHTYNYTYAQAPKYAVSSGPSTGYSSPSAPGIPKGYVQAPPPNYVQRPVPPPHQCFAPGTPVWTQSGPRPIETVTVGDLVLAQHPETGELAYRPVLQVTFGGPVPVLQLSIAGEKITTTYGHRFWVAGEGWKMAKQLKPAARLHAVEQQLDVTAVEKGQDVSCYNLIVDEFHTFFVGESRLLVHDRSCPAPTTATIPGWRAPEGAERDLTASVAD